MIIVGIDNSINSPGIVKFELDENLNIKSKDYLGFTQVKKNQTDKIIYYKKNEFNNSISQYLYNRNKIVQFAGTPDYLAFEDYAFAAKGKVFNIAESTGILKSTFFEMGSKIRLYDPCSIKMFSTGYGNADKVRMKETYDNLSEDDKLEGSVNDDIVDAFFIGKLMIAELRLRKGIDRLTNYPEEVVRVFNRVTKAHPENILVEEFICNCGV